MGALLYPLQDLLYRTTALADTSASPVIREAYDFDAYGNTLIFRNVGSPPGPITFNDTGTLDMQVTSPTCPFLFTGQRFDPETGLYYYKRRYYAPALGRFLNRDPIGYKGGINLYGYVGDAPPRFTDPTGKDVYLETYGGSSNCGDETCDSCCSPCNAYHQRICVDTWDAKGNNTGCRCFSFRQDGHQFPIPRTTWFGHSSFQCCILSGRVYEDTTAESYNIDKRKKTTQAEDERVLQRLLSLDKTYNGYSVARHNCRAFSLWEFDDVEGTVVDP